jgi:DNA-binding transcriptional LysR family regulator
MDFRQLTYFVQILRDGSFAKAAANLYLTQQGLRVSIKRLEDELNTTLLKRTSSGLVPTKAGLYLYHQAEKILKLLSECECYFNVSISQSNHLVVACVVDLIGFCPDFFLSILSDKSQIPPIRLIENTAKTCEDLVFRNEADVALVPGPIDRQKFSNIKLFRCSHVFIVNQQHPLASLECVDFEQLSGYKFVAFNQEFKTHDMFIQRCLEAGFEPNIVMKLQRTTEILRMVQSNPDYIGICSNYHATHFLLPGLKALSVKDETFCWDIHLIKKKDTISTSAIEQFKQQAITYFREKTLADSLI